MAKAVLGFNEHLEHISEVTVVSLISADNELVTKDTTVAGGFGDRDAGISLKWTDQDVHIFTPLASDSVPSRRKHRRLSASSMTLSSQGLEVLSSIIWTDGLGIRSSVSGHKRRSSKTLRDLLLS